MQDNYEIIEKYIFGLLLIHGIELLKPLLFPK